MEQSDHVSIHQRHGQRLQQQNGDRNLTVDDSVAVGHEKLEATPVVLEGGVGEDEQNVSRLLHAFHNVLGNVPARDEVSLVDAQRQPTGTF